MQSSDTVHVQNGVESHPIMIEKVFRNISREEFVAMGANFFGSFGSGQFA